MIGKSNYSQKVIEMIKTLAQHMGVILIAEGVEKAEQISFLQSVHCEYVQGFYYAKPSDIQATTELLKSGPTWR
jgi:EAL domain-containing protein (putative c-di-GMP-specific phosphodiesterase class I)